MLSESFVHIWLILLRVMQENKWVVFYETRFSLTLVQANLCLCLHYAPLLSPQLTVSTLVSCLYCQGYHSPDNVKFPDNSPNGSRHSSAALGMLSVTRIMPVLVLLSVVGVGMQQCMI